MAVFTAARREKQPLQNANVSKRILSRSHSKLVLNGTRGTGWHKPSIYIYLPSRVAHKLIYSTRDSEELSDCVVLYREAAFWSLVPTFV